MANSRPSSMIECSSGAEMNPLAFYSTSYSTTHGNAVQKPLQISPSHKQSNIAGRVPDTDKIIYKPKRTAYSKNMVPYVVYSKKVDENEYFHDDHHFLTSNCQDYQPPSTLPQIPNNNGRFNVVEVRNSGFTRKHAGRQNAQFSNKPSDFTTTSNASYQDPTPLQLCKIYKDMVGDAHGRPIPRSQAVIGHKTSTGFTSNPTATHKFSEYNEFAGRRAKMEEMAREAALPPRAYNISKVDDDGYTRVSKVGEYISEPESKLHLSKSQGAGVNAVDGNEVDYTNPHITSVSQFVYQKPNVPYHSLDKTYHIGHKQASGSLRNLPEPEMLGIRDPGRFKTVTSTSYVKPKDTFSLSNITCTEVPPSGYSKGNNSLSSLATLPDGQEQIHPTIAKARRIRDRGLYQNVVIV